MDGEVSVLLHCAAWGGLLESQVQVELSESFNRQTVSFLERQIGEVWTERVSKQPWLFNGCKFRLHSFCLAGSTSIPSSFLSPEHPRRTHSPPVGNAELTEDDETEPLLTLRLGLTCYKDFLGTNWSSRASQLRQLGEAQFGDPLALLAQPLGVGAILCTADSQVVFIRRSQRVAEAGGLLDIPGGHPEPKAVCELLGRMVCEEQITVDMMQQRPVVSELFSSVCTEIKDEVNIPLGALRKPILMGVALNHTSAGRPSAEFYVSCSMTSNDVRRLYWKGGAEAQESTDIVFLSRREVLQLDVSSSLWSEMCPSAKGAVLLYQTVKPDEDEGTAGVTTTS
ncbi:uridine diphosphate glucose pyrophosphatase NUDT22 [Antennarius striatus]|uniref:uridine diphosphate glucose pyrophosphatase NUDT22 n=1 Tax=Antennarius striatus TaxID=241820 RepID=UPI0035AE011C